MVILYGVGCAKDQLFVLNVKTCHSCHCMGEHAPHLVDCGEPVPVFIDFTWNCLRHLSTKNHHLKTKRMIIHSSSLNDSHWCWQDSTACDWSQCNAVPSKTKRFRGCLPVKLWDLCYTSGWRAFGQTVANIPRQIKFRTACSSHTSEWAYVGVNCMLQWDHVGAVEDDWMRCSGSDSSSVLHIPQRVIALNWHILPRHRLSPGLLLLFLQLGDLSAF